MLLTFCIQISQEAVQVVWYSHLFKNFAHFVVTHTVKGFRIVSKAEIDVFLELSCFFDDLRDVGNLISGSSAFSKSILNIWKFLVHILLRPSLKDFEHYLASIWNECNCTVVWTFLSLPSLGPNLFQSRGYCWVFQICWHIDCSTFTASSFRIWNSLAGIPSLPPGLFIVMLPKQHEFPLLKVHGVMYVIATKWLVTNKKSLLLFFFFFWYCFYHTLYDTCGRFHMFIFILNY